MTNWIKIGLITKEIIEKKVFNFNNRSRTIYFSIKNLKTL